MSVTTDIVGSWRHPRRVIRRHLDRQKSEPFAFSLLVVFLVLVFIAQWPRLSRDAALPPEVPLLPALLATGLALLAAIPVLYGVAAVSHLAARAVGGTGDYHGARLALFLALLSASPLMLLQGLTVGFLGQGAQALAVGVVALIVFGTVWISMLIEAET